MRCPKCGKKLIDGTDKCPVCNTVISGGNAKNTTGSLNKAPVQSNSAAKKRCSRCGRLLNQGVCSFCGATVSAAVPKPSTNSAPNTAPTTAQTSSNAASATAPTVHQQPANSASSIPPANTLPRMTLQNPAPTMTGYQRAVTPAKTVAASASKIWLIIIAVFIIGVGGLAILFINKDNSKNPKLDKETAVKLFIEGYPTEDEFISTECTELNNDSEKAEGTIKTSYETKFCIKTEYHVARYQYDDKQDQWTLLQVPMTSTSPDSYEWIADKLVGEWKYDGTGSSNVKANITIKSDNGRLYVDSAALVDSSRWKSYYFSGPGYLFDDPTNAYVAVKLKSDDGSEAYIYISGQGYSPEGVFVTRGPITKFQLER